MKPMTVKDVVNATGLPRETLRYYEHAGLLGKPKRGSNGYRLFATSDLERLEFIMKTKKAGFKIREIKELINLKEVGQATGRLGRDIARARTRKIDEQMAALRVVRAILQNFAKRCEAEGLDEPCSLNFHLDSVPPPPSDVSLLPVGETGTQNK